MMLLYPSLLTPLLGFPPRRARPGWSGGRCRARLAEVPPSHVGQQSRDRLIGGSGLDRAGLRCEPAGQAEVSSGRIAHN
jgi:hypothetical protein